MQWLSAKVSTTVASHTRLLPLYQGFRVKPSGPLFFVRPTGSRTEGRPMRVNDRLRMEFMSECLGKRPALQKRPWSPNLSTSFPQRHSVLSKILAPVRSTVAIRSSSGVSRFPTLAIGKASDQAAVWLLCAVRSRQWFQGLGVSSSAASAPLQAMSSQADCVSFCRGDESWSANQASVALIPSPWGKVRVGINLLTRAWQAEDDDRKHGRDKSAAEGGQDL